MALKLVLASTVVDNQELARHFYSKIPGFTKHTALPMGEYRRLTVETRESAHGIV